MNNYGRDGLMAVNSQGRYARDYEPNSYDGPVETGLTGDIVSNACPFASIELLSALRWRRASAVFGKTL